MVKICAYKYPIENDTYQSYFDMYPYSLHDFQKWAIEGIVSGNHLLISAPTGSGKTFGGEFAITHLHSLKKKVIYTTPIKSLSNEKFYSFTLKYPHISIGLITGDIKTNPDADVLIMTTEILMNKLYQLRSNTSNSSLNTTSASNSSFDMDIENELGCVVFDEIHFINDEHRGHVWEQCIMLLPPHIQMIGLSATLDDPVKFASWLEASHSHSHSSPSFKEVYLTRKLTRAVPLIHYTFITANSSVNKIIKDKTLQAEINQYINKPHIILDKNVLTEAPLSQTNKILALLSKHNICIKRQHVLNECATYLVEHDMLPALCYVFSRKQLEQCAKEVTANLLEFDSKIPYTVDRECEQIIRKMPNYEEYLHLPEYINLVHLLRKGVGIHHAGLMPVLREMVELLFAQGFIKMLFCTETMSVGINLPVKTTIFTDIYKYNGTHMRTLYSHEYTQAAGRAGRLGLDTVGHVIHLNNLFRNVEPIHYKMMMNNQPAVLKSKFKMSYNMILNMLTPLTEEKKSIDIITAFANKSMLYIDTLQQKERIQQQVDAKQLEYDELCASLEHLRTPMETIELYNTMQLNVKFSVNKKRKEFERKIQSIKDEYRWIEQDVISHNKLSISKRELQNIKDELTQDDDTIVNVLNILERGLFIDMSHQLTMMGCIAAQIREVPCLVFAEMYMSQVLTQLSAKQLVCVWSCFTQVRSSTDSIIISSDIEDIQVANALQQIVKRVDYYCDRENLLNIDSGMDYTIQYDLLHYVERWCDCETAEECKVVLQLLYLEKEIFLGEFVKALLKINNISAEFEKIADLTNNVEFLRKLKEIPHLTLKYVVTNQSLYVM